MLTQTVSHPEESESPLRASCGIKISILQQHASVCHNFGFAV